MTSKATAKYSPDTKKHRPSIRRDKFIKELATAPTPTEAARRAGYSPLNAKVQAHALMHDSYVLDRIKHLGITGLDTLEDVAVNGTNELARVNAGKTLVETAYGKPKDSSIIAAGDITINIAKLV